MINLIDLFFTLLNFSIIVGLGVYGVVRYILPRLKSGMEQEKQLERALHADHHYLLGDQKQVEADLATQEAASVDFFNKINQWKATVHKQLSKRKTEQRAMQEEVAKRLERQSYYYRLKCMYQEVTPLVVTMVEQDLRSHFSDEQVGHAYVQRLLKGLKR